MCEAESYEQIMLGAHSRRADTLSAEEVSESLLKFAMEVSSWQCEVCKETMKTFLNFLVSPNYIKLIRKFLENVCHYLPHQIESTCLDYVAAYTDKLIEFIKEHLTPQLVCEKFGMCEAETYQQIMMAAHA